MPKMTFRAVVIRYIIISNTLIQKKFSYIRKRKPINFTMADLDAEAEDDNDDTFKPKKKK